MKSLKATIAADIAHPVESSLRLAAACNEHRLRVAEALVSFVKPDCLEADQYRILRHTVERLRSAGECQIIAVSSQAAGDGKTVTVLNLAGSLAQSPQARVLVVDADLRRPTVCEYLAVSRSGAPGLVDAILNEKYGLAQTVHRLEGLNLSVLPAGSGQSGAYELLSSPRLEALMNEARRHYDYVLVDTPPLVPFADCRIIGRLVDGFIVVVAAHKTPRKQLAEALSLLDRDKVIGVVFNQDDERHARDYGYYGYYGYRRDSAPTRAARRAWWHLRG